MQNLKLMNFKIRQSILSTRLLDRHIYKLPFSKRTDLIKISSRSQKTNSLDKKIFDEQLTIKKEEANQKFDSNSSSNKSNDASKLTGKQKLLIACGVIGLSGWIFNKTYLQGNLNNQISLYKKLPLKSLSRAWGGINSIDLPVPFRKPCFYLYGWLFSCNFDEIDISDLNEFRNLSEFFRRTLKPDARVIDTESCLVNPCDGRILNFGKSNKGYLEQVKGVNYSIKGFLGPQDWPTTKRNSKVEFRIEEGLPPSQLMDNDQFYESNILYNPEENCLYHCIIYLAPGDYHRFHSPTDWNIHYRRHFPGELFSVNPSVARWLEGLFNFNERVVYYGDWKYGFFSYTAVGATNVGSIKVGIDKDLTTNNKVIQRAGKYIDKNFVVDGKGVPIKRGMEFGEFNLGSTIVLIFEAPKNFEFETTPGEKILLGDQLGSSTRSSYL